MAETFVDYFGDGTTVRLDLDRLTISLSHRPRSGHSGWYEVPLAEVLNIDYRERAPFRPGWARLITATGTHPPDPARDPYSWRTGSDRIKPFVLLAILVAKQTRGRDEALVARDVLQDEIRSLREIVNLYREE